MFFQASYDDINFINKCVNANGYKNKIVCRAYTRKDIKTQEHKCWFIKQPQRAPMLVEKLRWQVRAPQERNDFQASYDDINFINKCVNVNGYKNKIVCRAYSRKGIRYQSTSIGFVNGPRGA